MLLQEPLKLTLNSTLGELNTHKFKVEAQILTEVVETEFLKTPQLPGVLITKDSMVIGMISRQKFFEKLSEEYSRELYLKRPISVLLSIVEYQGLKINSNCSIDQALIKALKRSPDFLYEPIIVVSESGELGILELNLLILAQSQIFSEMNGILIQQENATRKYADSLQQEQEKVKEYANNLEIQQMELEQRNQLLEAQKNQLYEQTKQLSEQKQAIEQLNQKFSQIGKLISKEGKQTFKEMLRSVDEVSKRTDKIQEVCSNFKNKLMIVYKATDSITKVSKKVDMLSFQGSVLSTHLQKQDSNKPQDNLSLDIVASEINNLSQKLLELNNQIHEITLEFNAGIEQLTEEANKSQKVTQTLIDRSQRTHKAIIQLENLVNQELSEAVS